MLEALQVDLLLQQDSLKGVGGNVSDSLRKYCDSVCIYIYIYTWTNFWVFLSQGIDVNPLVALPLLVTTGQCPRNIDEVSHILCKFFKVVVFGLRSSIPMHLPVTIT